MSIHAKKQSHWNPNLLMGPGLRKRVSKPQTMVTFRVGAESIKETFLIHKIFACAHSPLFNAAFESELIEGSTQNMQLEDIDPHVFGLLVDWLHNKEINGHDPTETATTADLQLHMIGNLYPLCYVLRNRAPAAEMTCVLAEALMSRIDEEAHVFGLPRTSMFDLTETALY
ncbi:uncharacterized protein RSE6_11000 [Rhynchosporium secalis]|uniref:BTB domain-containing protein n=1 Tax=Rhynchosporium secalis TaxID=38038 RepID=A0A1E1MLX6_RHYSE|nr:uncharacterized protein RSE6_11000 [Rhynchosporium secalis]